MVSLFVSGVSREVIMKKNSIRKFLKVRLPEWGIWIMLCLVTLVFFAELYFFTCYNYELMDGAKSGIAITGVIIQKQGELIKTQAEYLEQMKMVNRVLETRLQASEEENAALKNDIVATFGPFAENLGYRIVFVGGRAFVQKDDGTVGLK
jgi:hypothetical protein